MLQIGTKIKVINEGRSLYNINEKRILIGKTGVIESIVNVGFHYGSYAYIIRFDDADAQFYNTLSKLFFRPDEIMEVIEDTIIDGNKKIIINSPVTICIIYDKNSRNYFKGISKCMNNDIYNREKGIKIATLRAEIAQKQNELNELCQ